MVLFYSVYFFILGAIVGSFVNVLVYRLPRGEGVVKGRSRCPHCHKTLAWIDLIPVVSFVFLRGRCRYCRQTIHWQYPLVELGSGLLFCSAYRWLEGLSVLDLGFSIFLLAIFLALGVSDLRFFILPDEILVAGALMGLLYGGGEKLRLFNGHYNILSAGHLMAAALFGGSLYLIWLFSKGTWIGLGDAKLMALMGLIFGGPGSFFIFCAAIVFGGIMGLILYLGRQANLKTKLPLGTYLCLMAGIYIFQGFWIADKLRFYLIFR